MTQYAQQLRSVSLRATPIRMEVLTLLEKTTTPLDIASIIRELHGKGDPATIFRIINSFVQKGLVRKLQFREDKMRYEIASKKDHHHLICLHCGDIEDISDCKIEHFESNIAKKKKFLIKNHSLEFFGLCNNCQK